VKELYFSPVQPEKEQYVMGRPINEYEIPQLIRLNNYGMFEKNDTPPDHAPPPLTIREMLAGLRNGNIIDGAFSHGQPIGFSWFVPQADQLYVNVLSVHPEHRDKGLGTIFLQNGDRWANELGLTRCSLAVDPWNGRGVNAYLKHGYEVTDFKDEYYGPAYPDTQRFIMTKILNRQKERYTEYVDIQVNEPDKVKYALSQGFVGTNLLRSECYDDRQNVVTFQR
jgi:ribosomal protein S18 acetylase RimI-like enzyme